MNCPGYLLIVSQVILQTYIESLRARTGQTFSVNHHGGVKTITGEKVKRCEIFNIDCDCVQESGSSKLFQPANKKL